MELGNCFWLDHRILVSTQSRYPVSVKKIKDHLISCLKELKIDYPAEISVTIIGDRKMHDLNLKYRQKDKTTNVLSFPANENKEGIIFPEEVAVGGRRHLGDIMISYPAAIRDASDERKLVDTKIFELLEHGLLHLLNQHHPE